MFFKKLSLVTETFINRLSLKFSNELKGWFVVATCHNKNIAIVQGIRPRVAPNVSPRVSARLLVRLFVPKSLANSLSESLGSDYLHDSRQDSLRDSFFTPYGEECKEYLALEKIALFSNPKAVSLSLFQQPLVIGQCL